MRRALRFVPYACAMVDIMPPISQWVLAGGALPRLSPSEVRPVGCVDSVCQDDIEESPGPFFFYLLAQGQSGLGFLPPLSP